MEISIERQGPVVDVSLEGELLAANRQALKDAVLEQLAEGGRLFRIDFEHTGYIDSSGLGVLVSLLKKIREEKGELHLTNLNADIRSLFTLTKLDSLFGLDETGSDGPPTPVDQVMPSPASAPEQTRPNAAN